MLSKKEIQDFFIKFLWDYIKDIINPYIFLALSSIGGYMLTQNIIAWLLIFSGLSGMIYVTQCFLLKIHKEKINQFFNITNKLVIRDDILITSTFITNSQKVAIRINYFIYNYSISLINASFNSKTQYSIKILGKKDQTQVLYTEKSPNYPKISPFLPFDHNRAITTYPIEIPFEEGMLIEVSCDLYLDYNANNEQEFQQTEKIIKLQFKLIKTINDKNEPIIIAQPA